MDKYDLDSLLGQTQYKAPASFTDEVMKKIYLQQNSSQRTERHFSAGLSLIAAGLITLFINITPLMDVLINKETYQKKLPGEIVNSSRTAGTIEYITLKIDSALQKPFEFLMDQVIKEDH